MDAGGTQLHVINVYGWPLGTPDLWKNQNALWKEMFCHVAGLGDVPWVMAGDWNATPDQIWVPALAPRAAGWLPDLGARWVVPVAKTSPTSPCPQQQDAPLHPPAADQGPPVDGLPQGEDADGPGEDLQGTAPSGTGSASDDPGQDVPGALIGDILFAEASLTAPAAPAADLPAAAPPSPCGQPAAPLSSPLPDFGDEEFEEVAQVPVPEAALVAEEFEEAAQVLVPEGEVDDAAGGSRPAGAQPDSAAWLGGPDPDARLPVRPGAYQGPVTPPEVYGGVKQEQEEEE